ncbi:hypothetical protein C8Q74DRAFT_1282866 [Fomes fomentarius]|nr:hypothetical protein C8Q74DRAFT_1282866 [Fomes fomentarius]
MYARSSPARVFSVTTRPPCRFFQRQSITLYRASMNEPTLWLIVGTSAAVAVVLVITLALLWYCSPRRTTSKVSRPDLSAEELPTTVVDVSPHPTRNSLLISSPSPLRALKLPPSEPQKLKRTRHRWSSLMPLNVARTSPSLPRIAESPISPSLTTAARNDVTSAVLQLETRAQNSRPTSASTSMDTAAGPEGGAYSSNSASVQVLGRSLPSTSVVFIGGACSDSNH